MKKILMVLFLLGGSLAGYADSASDTRTPGSYLPLFEAPPNTTALQALNALLQNGRISPADYQRRLLQMTSPSPMRPSSKRQLQRPSGRVRDVRNKDVASY